MTARTLADVSTSRDNNFNLLRFGAAGGVFLSHCVSVSGHGFGGKPQLLGFISVHVFFLISGFLVTQSFFRRRDVVDYLKSRCLRIFPALILAVIYTVFVIGLMCTTLGVGDYLSDSSLYNYIARNILLFSPDLPFTLPGVFESAAMKKANAPLWTLPWEVYLYLGVALIGWISLKFAGNNPDATLKFFGVIAVVVTAYFFTSFVAKYGFESETFPHLVNKDGTRLIAMFGLGSLLYCFRTRIPLSHLLFAGLIVLVAVSFMYRPIAIAVAYGALAYLILYLAYVPGGFIRQFNRLGDYSYGLYIFGFPTQQALEQFAPNLSLPVFTLVSFVLTMVLSVASWHIVESRALRLRTGVQ